MFAANQMSSDLPLLFANRRLVRLTLVVGTGLVQHGGTNGSDPRRGTREDVGDSTSAGSVFVTRSTLITRSGQQSDTLQTDLHELDVDLVHVIEGLLSGRATSDLALQVFRPAPRHRNSKREALGVEETSGKLVHPVVDGPVPESSVQGK